MVINLTWEPGGQLLNMAVAGGSLKRTHAQPPYSDEEGLFTLSTKSTNDNGTAMQPEAYRLLTLPAVYQHSSLFKLTCTTN